MEPGKDRPRGMEGIALAAMLEQFNAHLAEKCAKAEETQVNRVRADVLAQCRAKAQARLRLDVDGLEGVREIIAEPAALYRGLRWVEVVPPEDFSIPEDWPAMADKISQHRQILAIVNRRGDARELAKRLPQAVHLSANLCGEHRSRLIRYIKWRLKKGCALCVVSTQLIEAGVDVDFPVVFRAFAGLDSIAQATGRCNREGKLPDGPGRVFVFNPPQPSPLGLLRKVENTAKELLCR